MRALINLINRKIASLLGTSKINSIDQRVKRIEEVVLFGQIENFLNENLLNNPKYVGTKRITHYHQSVFSQNGEDGIIEEIFKRIGTTNNYFVEFGAHGIKNNTTYLLQKDWKGLWIVGSEMGRKAIASIFKTQLAKGNLSTLEAWITRDNIQTLLQQANVPIQFDFLSIDIDGNDYWVWDKIVDFQPRVVCIEYNATYPPNHPWVMSYKADHIWNGTSYFGASLLALQKLSKSKGYALEGCDFAGCNAFFVKESENLTLFESPFTAEHHYEPARYFIRKPSGHPHGFGEFHLV